MTVTRCTMGPMTTTKCFDKETAGQQLSAVEKQLKMLEGFEKGVQKHMQDRKKFMSVKNMVRYARGLDYICQQREQLQSHARYLQEMPNCSK